MLPRINKLCTPRTKHSFQHLFSDSTVTVSRLVKALVPRSKELVKNTGKLFHQLHSLQNQDGRSTMVTPSEAAPAPPCPCLNPLWSAVHSSKFSTKVKMEGRQKTVITLSTSDQRMRTQERLNGEPVFV